MSTHRTNEFANAIFNEFKDSYDESDRKKPATVAMTTHVEVSDDDALYIYVENNFEMPPNKFKQYCERVKEDFVKAMPGRTIIVGANDLKFTVISKKQEFKAKLDGTL